MSVHIAIDGFGRMGRLALRAAWGFDPAVPASLSAPVGAWGAGTFDIVHINEPNGSAEMAAHLMAFDSVHGRWPVPTAACGAGAIAIGERRIGCSMAARPGDTDWRAMGIDLVLECSGKFKSRNTIAPYSDAGVRKVVVSAPVKGDALNIVMGVKIVAWYDNEMGYAHRLYELTEKVARSLL
jgi:glyceraldehyde 3-phosphate dehydrogenase